MAVQLEPGAVIAGRYRLDRLIGEGGMGVVWAATEIATGKPFAIKHLRSEAASDAETRKRFLREVQATSAIAHPNIVGIHDFVETPAQLPAIVMDLLDGESLSARLERDKRLSVADTAGILVPVISAVGTAHSLGIIHRDLKPDNIFLSRSEGGVICVKVLDFGIAKLTTGNADSTSASVITGTWALLGTPHYMAPEQIIGERDIDHRADIWALGAILYECLAGIRPAEATTPGKIFELILLKGIKPLESVAPGIPSDIAALVGRMLEREREDRPSDLVEVQSVLERHTHVTAPRFDKPAEARLSLTGELPGSMPVGASSKATRAVSNATTQDVRIRPVPSSLRPPPSDRAPETRPAPEALRDERISEGSRDAKNRTSRRDAAPSPAGERRTRGSTALIAFVFLLAVGAGAAGGALLMRARARSGSDFDSGSAADKASASVHDSIKISNSGAGAGEVGACPSGMAFIKGGIFLMGSKEGKEEEQPVHRLEVSSFCLDLREVTVAAYTACAAEGACTPAATTVKWDRISDEVKQLESSFCSGYQTDRMDHPINCVDWNQADAFCQSHGKRLPSEEEWEYAARGGSEQRTYAWGDAPPGAGLANLCGAECVEMLKKHGRETPFISSSSFRGINDGWSTTAPPGSFPKGSSREGVLDLTGNVWEWTSSPFCAYPSHSCSNPSRVFRGGGWATFLPLSVRAATRLYSHPTHRYMDIGFRCASPPK